MSLNRKVLIAAAAGIAVGMAANRMALAPVVTVIENIQPIGTLWTNAMMMTTVPLLIAGMVSVFAGMSDSRILGRLSGLSLAGFAFLLLGAAALTVLFALPLLSTISIEGWPGPTPMERATGMGTVALPLPSISLWFTSLVPSNPVQAAAGRALFPVVFFSVALGAAAAHSPEKSRQTLSRFFGGAYEALLKVALMVLSIAPIPVFVLSLSLGIAFGIGGAGVAAIYIVIIGGTCLLFTLLLHPLAARLGGFSMSRFSRACIPAQLAAATSRSSRTAVPAMIAAAERDLGVPPAVARVVVPVGEALFAPGTVISQVAGVLLVAHLYEIALAPLVLLQLIGYAALVSTRSAEIATGSILVMVPFYLMIGAPPAGLGLLLVLDTIPQALRALVNVTGNMTVTTFVARRANVFVPGSAASSSPA